MPEGVPAAALHPEPRLSAPAGWPFGEEFPRTCGTGRFAGGALFWTDFLYDDHGATGIPVDIPTGGLVPPRGTYVYPLRSSCFHELEYFWACDRMCA